MQRLDKVFPQTAAQKVPEWPSYNNFRKVTQNPHFLKKCKRGTNRNFSKIAKKDALALKAQKNSRPDRIILWFLCSESAKTGHNLGAHSAPKVPEWPSYGNFCKVTPNPHFLRKCKGGTKRNLSKIAQKDAPAEKAQKHCGANDIILLLRCT